MSETTTRREAQKVELTKALLDEKLGIRPHRQSMIWDTKEDGLSVLISRGPKNKRQGTLSFRVVYYLKSSPGKPRYLNLGRYEKGVTNLQTIRDAARKARTAAREGTDPKRPKLTGKFAESVAKFVTDHAEGNRTAHETKRIFAVYVTPEWGDKNIEEIKKSDVSDLLTKIGKKRIEHNGKKVGGHAMARATRSQLVTLFNWWDAKHGSDDFRSPMRKLMPSDKMLAKSEPRPRHLSDDEIVAMWKAAGEQGTYGAAVRMALLTAQRFIKVVTMRRGDIRENMWDASRTDDPRNKRVSPVWLSRLAKEVLDRVPEIDPGHPKHQDLVFSLNGIHPIANMSNRKDVLDKRMQELLPDQPIEPWQHRDLRRTARTIFAKLRVSNEVAEHCLAHAMPMIERTYNRHSYAEEKRHAFEALSNYVETLVNPPQGNVVALRG